MKKQGPNILQTLLVAVLATTCFVQAQAQEPCMRNALSISVRPSIPYAEFLIRFAEFLDTRIILQAGIGYSLCRHPYLSATKLWERPTGRLRYQNHCR